jgi:hypothetical protein
MAVYKVPQDVEADDKLIGPFSFRQFIYIIIALISIALAWGLAQVFIALAIIPLPFIVFFGALALPLRKDQPMEIYLAAVISYYLKPRKRLWEPDGIQSLVEITAPKVVEVKRSKDLSQTEAEQRLSYLANIVDTGGWAVRGVVSSANPDSAMQNDAYFAAQQTEDVLSTDSGVARSFNTMINQAEDERREEMIARMKQPPTPQTVPAIVPQVSNPYTTLTSTPAVATAPQTPPDPSAPHLTYNPYPTSIHQTVINPLGEGPAPQTTPALAPAATLPPVQPATQNTQTKQTSTSEAPISPDIINLANNSDLSIETIAHEANRIHQKEENLPEDEVVISLR